MEIGGEKWGTMFDYPIVHLWMESLSGFETLIMFHRTKKKA
jgi:hypothetical protein